MPFLELEQRAYAADIQAEVDGIEPLYLEDKPVLANQHFVVRSGIKEMLMMSELAAAGKADCVGRCRESIRSP